MFCPKCGAAVEDGARFCGKCGHAFTEQPAAQEPAVQETATQQPVAQKPAAEPSAAMQTVNQVADKVSAAIGVVTGKVDAFIRGSDKFTLMGLGAAVLCVIMLFVGIYSAMNVDFYELPALSLIMAGEIDDIEDAKDEMGDDIERMEEYLDDLDLSTKETKLAKDFLKKGKDLSKTFSINNMKALVKSAEKLANGVDADIDDFDMEVDEIMSIITVVEVIIWVSMLVPLGLAVASGLTRNFIVAIIALLPALPFYLLFGGIGWGLLAIAGYVLQVYAFFKRKKERDAQKRAAAAA